MRILRIENTSGVATELARSQRALGHEAIVLETYRPLYAFEHDVSTFYEGSSCGSNGAMGLELLMGDVA